MTYARSKCITRMIGRGKTQRRKICFDKHGNIVSNTSATKKRSAKKRSAKRR